MRPQGKRKPFQGKQKHKDLREFKNQEIKRSLVHRARLRKNYFKLIESEENGRPDERPLDHPDPSLEKQFLDSESQEDKHTPASESQEDKPEHKHTARKPLPPQKAKLDFAERAKKAKDRKVQRREDELRRVQERRQRLEEERRKRELKKESLSKRTSRGQPVMGPRINDLLEKIRLKQ